MGIIFIFVLFYFSLELFRNYIFRLALCIKASDENWNPQALFDYTVDDRTTIQWWIFTQFV